MIVRTDTDADGAVSDNPPFDELPPPYGTSQKGVRVAAGDTDDSGTFIELITASGGPNQPVKIFDDSADAGSLLSDNPPEDSFGATTAGTGSFVAFARATRPTKYAAVNVPAAIADNATTFNRLTIPASAGIIRDLDVDLGISHSFDGDLDLTLQHTRPDGTHVTTLFTDVGGSCEGFLVTMNDEAGLDIGGATCAKPDGAISGGSTPRTRCCSRTSMAKTHPARGTSASSTTRPATSAPSTTGT